jgi:hypothetical protein
MSFIKSALNLFKEMLPPEPEAIVPVEDPNVVESQKKKYKPVTQMGLGLLGEHVVFKRKFRYTLEATFGDNYIPETFVRISTRPSFIISEPPMDFSGDITTTFNCYTDAEMEPVYKVLREIYDLKSQTNQTKKADVLGALTLRLYDGMGNLLERWEATKVFPTSINWNDGFDSYDVPETEIVWRYQNITWHGSDQALFPPSCQAPNASTS